MSDLPLQRYFIIDAVPSDDTSKKKKYNIDYYSKRIPFELRLKWPTLQVQFAAQCLAERGTHYITNYNTKSNHSLH